MQSTGRRHCTGYSIARRAAWVTIRWLMEVYILRCWAEGSSDAEVEQLKYVLYGDPFSTTGWG